MRYKFMMGSEVKELQAQKLRVLDSKVYSHGQLVSAGQIYRIHKANPNIYTMAIDVLTNSPVAYISAIPLKRGTLSKTYRDGFNEEEFSVSDIVRPENERSFDLFLSSIVIDRDLKDAHARALIFKGMAQKFVQYIHGIMLEGRFPKEASAHAVSKEGMRICDGLGMQKMSSLKNGTILYHTSNISKSFFYKIMTDSERGKIRQLITERLFDENILCES